MRPRRGSSPVKARIFVIKSSVRTGIVAVNPNPGPSGPPSRRLTRENLTYAKAKAKVSLPTLNMPNPDDDPTP